MSKYVKELMMDQLKADLGDDRSVLILDFKGLDAIAEHQLRTDLRKKRIRVRTLKNTLAKRVFADMGIGGLAQFLEGPSVAVWGGDGVAELAKEVSDKVKKLKTPAIKGGAVDGIVISPSQVEDITKLPSREVLIAQLLGLMLSPAQQVLALAGAPASTLMGQLEALAERSTEAPTEPPAAGGDTPEPPAASAAP